MPRTALILLLAVGAFPPRAPAQVSPESLDVLFIGNSYTYYNNLPALLEEIAAADPSGPRIRASMVARGGACLEDHRAEESGLHELEDDAPDFVVLQGQSTFCRVLLVDGRYRVADAGSYRRHGRFYVEAIRESGSVPVLFGHWKREEAPAWDQWAIDEAVWGLARETRARVAPVGDAFQIALRGDPGLELYDADHSHPAPTGSFLAAQVLYVVLTGRDPVALDEASGPLVEPGDGTVHRDSVVTLAAVEPAVASLVAEVAREAVSRALPVDSPRPVVPAPVLPVLPRARGRAVSADELSGTWKGTFDLYPSPAVLTLRLDSLGGEWTADARVDFGGRPDDIVPSLIEVERMSGGIRFVDPDGPNGGEVRYRAVWIDERLVGVAEIVVPGSSIYGIADWRLRKVTLDREDPGPLQEDGVRARDNRRRLP